MIKPAYDWMMRMAGHGNAGHALFWVAFIESSVFPIPPDVMLIPMVMANRLKAWTYATICTVGSVLGGILGYAIGYLLLEYIGEPILAFYGQARKFAEVSQWFNEWGALILIAKGWTPFPYKVLTILAGATHMNLLAFIGASIVARAMRFYLVAALLYWFGPPIREFIERRLSLVTTVFIVVLVGGFVAIRYLF
ncbi:MAG: YqaA family protein [Hyphomicrobiaceae bacterium]|nr:YqaA family protein [Hyphomicrobiaceae bacterium]